jgi:GT2 family glycosyltransferase
MDMTSNTAAEAPEVTIVVVPRERFSVALRSLDTLYQHTDHPFDLVYVDGNSPALLRDRLRHEAARRAFRLLRTEHYLSPNRARNLGVREATTPYVVFVDNDVIVTPGWLEALISCAHDTGAWVVGPLAFEGDLADGMVHNAGGFCHFEGAPGRRHLVQDNRYGHRHLSELPGGLRRFAVDYVEFHCVLVRRDAFDAIGPLDEGLLSTREHLDLCLQVAAHGGEVWSDCSSLVTYDNPPPVPLRDLPFFMLRWSEAWNVASLRHFVAKYELDPAYVDRASGMRERRRIVVRPASEMVRRHLGDRPAAATKWALDAGERAINTVVVRRMARSADLAAG